MEVTSSSGRLKHSFTGISCLEFNFRIILHLFLNVLNFQNLNLHIQHGVDHVHRCCIYIHNMASTLYTGTVWESQDSAILLTLSYMCIATTEILTTVMRLNVHNAMNPLWK